MRRRRVRGLSLVEVVVAAAISTGVLGGAVAVLRSTSELARGAAAEDAASWRVTQALDAVVEEIRRSSGASVLHLDGTPFSNGTSDSGFTSRRVLTFSGTPTLAPARTIRFDLAPSATEGELVNAAGPVVQTVARGITEFQVTRTAGSYVVTIAAQSGDRQSLRKARGSVTVRSRNP